MKQQIAVLKKYKNRRIYDGRSSRYVNMNEVRAMFLAEENIRIVCGSSNADLTGQILLQLLQQDEESTKTLPLVLLRQALIAGEKKEASAFNENVMQALIAADMASEDRNAAFDSNGLHEPQSPAVAPRQLAAVQRPAAAFSGAKDNGMDPLSDSLYKTER